MAWPWLRLTRAQLPRLHRAREAPPPPVHRDWQGRLSTWLLEPSILSRGGAPARRPRHSGIRFTVASDGTVSSLMVVKGSGFVTLDEAAVAMLCGGRVGRQVVPVGHTRLADGIARALAGTISASEMDRLMEECRIVAPGTVRVGCAPDGGRTRRRSMRHGSTGRQMTTSRRGEDRYSSSMDQRTRSPWCPTSMR